MKHYNYNDIRVLQELSLIPVQSRIGEIEIAVASGYLMGLIIRSKVREFQDKKEYEATKQLEFALNEFDRLERLIKEQNTEITRLKHENRILMSRVK